MFVVVTTVVPFVHVPTLADPPIVRWSLPVQDMSYSSMKAPEAVEWTHFQSNNMSHSHTRQWEWPDMDYVVVVVVVVVADDDSYPQTTPAPSRPLLVRQPTSV